MGWDDFIAVLLFLLGVSGFASWINSIPGGTIIYELRTELIGIGIAVFILGNAGDYMNRQAEKKRLILQMGSPDNGFAIEAVRQLNVRGWVEDGSLSKVDFRKANLAGANLVQADLSGSNFNQANLNGANMYGANLIKTRLGGADLRGANLNGAKLRWAYYTKGTTWPNGWDKEAIDRAGAIEVDKHGNRIIRQTTQ